jgi:hypothetical protein
MSVIDSGRPHLWLFEDENFATMVALHFPELYLEGYQKKMDRGQTICDGCEQNVEWEVDLGIGNCPDLPRLLPEKLSLEE